MAAASVKQEIEVCALCSSADSDLFMPEEYDAGAPGTLPRMNSILLHLSHNKPLPRGRICGSCAERAVDAYKFSTQISSNTAKPLSDKIRDLRKRLHQLTKRIDVFIVVGACSEGGYQEDDIIMVQKDKLAAAVAADEQQQTTKWQREQFQCSICPKSFQSREALSGHAESHAAGADAHWCWQCGAAARSPAALRAHRRAHSARALTCHLCAADFQSETSLHAHAAAGTCPAVCPACGAACVSRAALAAHARETHARGPPALCPRCFHLAHTEEERLSHSLQHRVSSHYACGAAGCLLRFRERSSLKEHVRRAHHAAPIAPAPAPSVGTRRTRARARNQQQSQVELQTAQVCIEPEPASAHRKADSASPGYEAASPTRKDEDEENVEYLDMDFFNDD